VGEISKEDLEAIRNSGPFDAEWYLDTYPDVKALGMDPLEHYLWLGRKLNRSRSAKDFQNGATINKDITDNIENSSIQKRRLVIFASYNEFGIINPYVKYYIDGLLDVSERIIFVADNDISEYEKKKIQRQSVNIISGRHGEYDFGSYKRGYIFAKENGFLQEVDELILCNDSCFGPVSNFGKMFLEMSERGADFWGITGSEFFQYHLQSYFLCFSKSVFLHKTFEEFLLSVKAHKTVQDVIKNYEVRLTKLLTDLGFKVDSVIRTQPEMENPRQRRPLSIEHYPCFLLDQGSPLIKVKALKKAACNLDGIDITLEKLKSSNPSLYEFAIQDDTINRYLSAEDASFSLIMPTYNRAHCIEKAVNSVLLQTHRNFELIIIDDGSVDGTEALISERYGDAIKEGRITYIRLPSSVGVCSARNIGLMAARFDWIAYVDSDNTIRPYFLKVFSQSIKENPEIYTFYAEFCRREDGKIGGGIFDYQRLRQGNFIDLGVFVHHRKCFEEMGGFDRSLKRLVDWDLILRYTRSYPPRYIPNILLDYSDNEDPNRISRKESALKSRIQITNKHDINKTISTVILSYNQEKFVEKAIRSALSQKGDFDHEIILSDDGSIDGTPEIIDKYCRSHPNLIRSVGGGVNMGVSANFRRAFEEAAGEFVAILEGDDYWIDDQKLNAQAHFLRENPDCSMVFSKINVCNLKDKSFKTLERQDSIKKNKLTGQDFLNHPTMNLIANFSCCMFRSELMKKLPKILFEHRFSEISLAFFLEKFGYIGYIDRIMSVYVQHPAGIWSGGDRDAQLRSGLMVRTVAKSVARVEYKEPIQKIIEKDYLSKLQKVPA